MNILEAIALKKDLEIRIENLGNRYVRNVTVLKGKKPHEDPNEILQEMDKSIAQLNDLCYRINAADLYVKNSTGKTLMELLIERESLYRRLNILRSALNEVTVGSFSEYAYNTKKLVEFDIIVSIESISKLVDEAEEQLRQVTSEIQKLDVKTEI